MTNSSKCSSPWRFSHGVMILFIFVVSFWNYENQKNKLSLTMDCLICGAIDIIPFYLILVFMKTTLQCMIVYVRYRYTILTVVMDTACKRSALVWSLLVRRACMIHSSTLMELTATFSRQCPWVFPTKLIIDQQKVVSGFARNKSVVVDQYSKPFSIAVSLFMCATKKSVILIETRYNSRIFYYK